MGMGSSIYSRKSFGAEDTGSVNDSMILWANKSLNYVFLKNDIIRYKNLVWYCLKDHLKITASEPGTDIGNQYWGGIVYTSPLSRLTKFIWTPSYTSSFQHKPAVSTIRFGNGYEQRIAKSINPDLKTLQLNFDQRTSREARAIIYFLQQRASIQAFAYDPGDIYSEQSYRTKYVCREWETNFTFKENYSIRAKFEEVSA